VDLRWGITAEQAEEGEALPLCLEAIRRCRPYFIGLLGERYGWVPEEITEELMIREPWLVEHRGQSVTELEILHGALNDPRSAEHAHFYSAIRPPSEPCRPINEPLFRKRQRGAASWQTSKGASARAACRCGKAIEIRPSSANGSCRT
jgi:hypothetical protein